MAGKRTELDKKISRAQKNARNKLYRIRQKGAINSEEFDPRVSQEELKHMNGSQKKAYLRKLELFNGRANKVIVQPGNGIAIPETKLKAYRQAELELNAARILRRAGIEEAVKSAAVRDISKIKDTVNKEISRRERADKLGKPYKPLKKSVEAMRGMPVDWNKLDIDYLAKAQSYYDPVFKQWKPGERNKFQDLVPIWMRESFPSVKSVEEQTRKAKEAKERIKVARKRYPQYREALIEKAMFSGYPELAEAIRALTYAQLDYLHYYTDFDAWGSFFSSPKGYIAGKQALFEEQRDQTDEAAAQMMAEILRARRIRPGQSGISNITYNKEWRGEKGFAKAGGKLGSKGLDPEIIETMSRASISGSRLGFRASIFDYKESKAESADGERMLHELSYEIARQIRHGK